MIYIMGQILNRFKYKRECYKCKLLEIEMTDLFNEHDMLHLPIIQVMQKRHMRKEHRHICIYVIYLLLISSL